MTVGTMSPSMLLTAFLIALQSANAFVQQQQRQVRLSSSSQLFQYNNNDYTPQTNVKVPLLDWIQYEQETLAKDGDAENFLLPLPSSQLPNELSTPFLYGIQLERPLDKLIMEEAKSIFYSESMNKQQEEEEEEEVLPFGDGGANMMSSDRPIFGRLVWKDGDSLVGAIGCTGEIVVSSSMDEVLDSESPPSDTPPTTMLCRGGFRFVVKSVVQSIPYPIVIVDELLDDDEATSDETASISNDDEDDDEDDDEYLDDYDSMPAEELIHKIMSMVQKLINYKVEDASSKERSLLEQSILENTIDNSKIQLDLTTIEQFQAEEMAAVWEIFQSSFVDDIAPSQRRFVLSMMAAELASLDNTARQKLLTTTNSLERLRYLCGKLDQAWGMQQARKLASQITDKTDEDDKDLKVGLPTLPQWARTIRKGSRIEYYWNEEYDWVAGEVIEEPTIQGGAFDELEVMMITVRFDDGEIHTIHARNALERFIHGLFRTRTDCVCMRK